MLADRLRTILDGIDKNEIEDPDGWWETGKGAAFGAGILAGVEAEAAKAESVIDRLEAMLREAQCLSRIYSPKIDAEIDEVLAAVKEWREGK
jgi:hypothetical protein